MRIKLHSIFALLSLGTTVSGQNFTLKANLSITGVQYSSVDFADVDGDGDLDFFAGGADPGYTLTSKLYKNDGNGNFTVSDDSTFIKIREGAVAFGDVNGDNFPDLIISGNTSGPTTKLYINDGLGNFTLSAAIFTQSTYGAMAFADIDNDSDNDLVITGFSSSFSAILELYINDGTGAFTLTTPAQSGLTGGGVSRGSVALEDVNGDGFEDIFITGSGVNNVLINALYMNDGDGTFTIKATPIPPIQTGSVSFADSDNDGDKDLLVVGSDAVSAKVAYLFSNDGDGNFIAVSGLPFIGAQYGKSVFADVNNDNYPDVFISGYRNPNRRADLYMNNGALGGFTQATVPFEGLTNASIAFADVDGDTDLDFMATGQAETGTLAKLYLNGLFLDVPETTSKDIGFYPNPVTDVLYLEFPFGVQASIAEVYSLTGQLVHSENLSGLTDYTIHFNKLPSGIYLVKISTNSGIQVERIIKS